MTPRPTPDHFQLAKRDGNPLRSYLIVNPKQAKHIPARPEIAWSTMAELAQRINVSDKSGLIVAFAETATAIGAVVALELGPDWRFTHSTRAQKRANRAYIDFEESHSHATGHHLAAETIVANSSNTLVFINDEYTTGKTLINAARATISAGFTPGRLLAGALIDRTTYADQCKIAEAGIENVASVVKLETGDLTQMALSIHGKSAQALKDSPSTSIEELSLRGFVQDPRFGVVIGEYYDKCNCIASSVINTITDTVKPGCKVAVLGTEECMFPALVLARALERECLCEAYCHSTTRSPILVSNEPDYPIRNGYSIRSVYDPSRKTFIYNIQEYDMLIVVTDALDSTISNGLADLAGVFNINRRTRVLAVMI